MLKSENIEYNNDTLKNTLDKIIESGSNSNGSWIKYSDGTLIQYGLLVKNLNITNISSQVDWYYSDGYVVEFPANFANMTMNVYSITDYATNLCKFNLSSKNSTTVENHTFRWFAIGRWK